jgi:thioredoxin-like negative regulator of GroEL
MEGIPGEFDRQLKERVNEDPRAAMKYHVKSIPPLLFFKNSRLIDSSLGAVHESMLRPKAEALL